MSLSETQPRPDIQTHVNTNVSKDMARVLLDARNLLSNLQARSLRQPTSPIRTDIAIIYAAFMIQDAFSSRGFNLTHPSVFLGQEEVTSVWEHSHQIVAEPLDLQWHRVHAKTPITVYDLRRGNNFPAGTAGVEYVAETDRYMQPELQPEMLRAVGVNISFFVDEPLLRQGIIIPLLPGENQGIEVAVRYYQNKFTVDYGNHQQSLYLDSEGIVAEQEQLLTTR